MTADINISGKNHYFYAFYLQRLFLWIVHKNEIEGDYELPQIDGSFRHLTYVIAVAELAQAAEYYRLGRRL